MSPNLNEWRRVHFRTNIYGLAGNENTYFGIGIGSGKGLVEVFNWWNEIKCQDMKSGKIFL